VFSCCALSPTFAPGNTVKDVGKLCTETLMGKFAEFPKK